MNRLKFKIKYIYIIFLVIILSLQNNYVYADTTKNTSTVSDLTLYSEADILIDAKSRKHFIRK